MFPRVPEAASIGPTHVARWREAACAPRAPRTRRCAMLDLVIKGGQVVMPHGVAALDVGVQGEKVVALGWPGTLAADAGHVVDAHGKIVVPGGIEPHAHISIPVPEQWTGRPEVMTQPPAAASSAAAFGGVTTIVDFAGDLTLTPDPHARRVSIAEAVERRRAVFRGHAYTDFAFHYILAGEVAPETVGEIGEAIQEGIASFKIFTTFRPIRVPYGHLWSIFAQVARHGGIMAVHAEEDDVVTYMTETLKREGRAQGCNLHLVHNNLSEDLGPSLALEGLGHVRDDVVLLREHGHDAAVPRYLGEDAPEVAVRDTDRPEGREDLEARDAFLDRFADLADRLRRDLAGQDVVEGDVRVGVTAEDGAPPLDRLGDRHAPGGRIRRERQVTGEADDGGHAPEGGRAAGRCRRLRHDLRTTAPLLPGRDRHARRRLDPAGDDDLAVGIDDVAGIRRQSAGPAQRDDLLALHADVERSDTVGHHDLSTLDHEVEHGAPPGPWSPWRAGGLSPPRDVGRPDTSRFGNAGEHRPNRRREGRDPSPSVEPLRRTRRLSQRRLAAGTALNCGRDLLLSTSYRTIHRRNQLGGPNGT